MLGIIEASSEPVMSLDFNMPTQPHDFEGDEYKWPYGLLSMRAWRLIDRPLTRRNIITPVQHGCGVEHRSAHSG
jgi:hypothetical protein